MSCQTDGECYRGHPIDLGGFFIVAAPFLNPCCDGRFTLSKSDKAQEAAEPGGEPQGQSVDNIGDALKLVLDLVEQDGNAEADNQFEQGFGGPETQQAPAQKPGMQQPPQR
jgi:hypothetical protein